MMEPFYPGPLTLNVRSRRLSEASAAGLDEICRAMKLEVEPRWFGCLKRLYKLGSVSVTRIVPAPGRCCLVA